MELDKKPRNKKRSLFDASERLSQVKDDQVRKKCKAVLESFQTLQNAANYQDKDQRDVLPTCDFMMVCRDAMLPNISSCKDGLWKRKSPLWAFLIPQGVDVKQLGADLEAVGKARLKEENVPKIVLSLRVVTPSRKLCMVRRMARKRTRKKSSRQQFEYDTFLK